MSTDTLTTTLDRALSERWRRWLLAVVAIAFFVGVLAHWVDDGPRIATDAALFQHVGWAATQGATPYVDVWDINPPLSFALGAALSLLVGGDPVRLQVLSATVTTLVAAAGVLLTGELAYDVTGDGRAALAAGLVLLLPAETYGLPAWGVRSQYFALAFGVLGLLLARRDRPGWAGAATAAAAGFWQPAGAVVPIALGVAWTREGRTGIGRATGGAALVTLLTVLPFALAGALRPLLVETVVAPFVGGPAYTLLGRTLAVPLALGYGALVVPVGLYGAVRAGTAAPRTRWWLLAGAAVFTGQVLFVNMNGALDALLWLAFLGVGVAVVVERLPRERARTALALVALLVLTGPAWHLGSPPLEATVHDQRRAAQPPIEPRLAREGRDVPSMRTIYWERMRPNTCHYRLSWTELRWIERTDARPTDERCGWATPQ